MSAPPRLAHLTTNSSTEPSCMPASSLSNRFECLGAIERLPQFDSRLGHCSYHLYYVWDFVHRTHFNFSQIQRDKLYANDKDALENYIDCFGRCVMANIMMMERDGKTRAMFQGKLFDFSPEILRLSKTLIETETESAPTKQNQGKKEEKREKKKEQSAEAAAGHSKMEVDEDGGEVSESKPEEGNVEEAAPKTSAHAKDDDGNWEDIGDEDEAGNGAQMIKYGKDGRRQNAWVLSS